MMEWKPLQEGIALQNILKQIIHLGQRKKRVESEIERRLAVEKLRGYIFGEKDYPNEVACLRTNLISARKILDSFYKSFPNSVLRFIDDAQRNQNWIINVDVGTEIQRTIKKMVRKKLSLSMNGLPILLVD